MSVVGLREKELDPDLEVVQLLEEYLAEARKGELRGFAAVFAYRGRESQTAIVGKNDLADQLYQLKALEIRLLKLKGLL